MNLAFTDEQNELRRMVHDFLDETSPETEVRRLTETPQGYDTDVWLRFAGELGLAGLAIPEEYGGAGYGFVELGIVLEEAGRTLFGAPLLSSVVLAASTLLALGDKAANADYLPAIAAGTTTATLAFAPPSARLATDADAVQVTAARNAQGWTLTGAASYVLDGHTADLLLVLARTGAGLSVFAVDGAAPGVTRTPQQTVDQTRRQATIVLDAVGARLVGEEGQARAVLAGVFDLATVALGAEQVGGAAHVLEQAVEYAKIRVQFGRPIGAFQAIKHKLADLHIIVESARSAAYHALWVAAESPDELPEAASLVGGCCGDAFVTTARENIQVHGGIGFTWEHPAHLYFKRAHSSRLLFGTPAQHRQRLAGLVLAASTD
ncbi:acyl-CoA dehydrogenase family protein [Frankia sp. R82]|uniref:acyl-CoA dehydrogenase family protein n=1 Tax=Frankia sp. R82 TaxID=2950553 RepID=UPI002043077D|nr:acyl-CoA dehydrogenase family protein [Frankia sp. R82]MCM3884550.1 acyl-CoA/acyl-ACP dehydrogenase [Frankia sp. R82]